MHQTVDLNVYGRSALALGFDAPEEMAVTQDVDLILPKIELSAMDANEDFWLAIEQTNTLLSSEGLYLTHIFLDDQVILSKDWLNKRMFIDQYGFTFIRLYRPSTEDLLLTKMMRVDPQDREDMLFLSKHLNWKREDFTSFFNQAVLPEISEIEEAFEANKKWLMMELFS